MRKCLLLSLTLLPLAGCVSSSVLHNQKMAVPTLPVDKVLVAGRTPELKVRQQWEQYCAGSLGPQAIPSMDTPAASARFPDDRQAIFKAASDLGADAVLLAEISPLKLYAPQQPPHSESQAERLREDSGTLNIPLRGEPQPVPELPEQYIEFILVDRQHQVLWSAIVQTHEANAIKAIAQSQCKSIRRVWREKGLLNP